MVNKDQLIKTFSLLPHPEGGYYKETYRSAEVIETNAKKFPHQRNYSTAIYFLIEKDNFSALHRIKSDELWHFYEGDALEVIEIDLKGNLMRTQVGRDILNGQTFQYTVKAGHWFGSRVLKTRLNDGSVVGGGSFSFVGCTVSPGFDFKDFEMAKRAELTRQFPQHEKIIAELTYC
jgi:predicted cupin superfamily sugar epimerase